MASVNLLRCPRDGNELEREGDSLRCTPGGHAWPISDGIPRFVESQGYAGAFGYQWARHAQTQLDSHNGLTLSRDRWFAVTCWPERMEGELMLEAGSGPGRFTEIAAATGGGPRDVRLLDGDRPEPREQPSLPQRDLRAGRPDVAARGLGVVRPRVLPRRPAAPAEPGRRLREPGEAREARRLARRRLLPANPDRPAPLEVRAAADHPAHAAGPALRDHRARRAAAPPHAWKGLRRIGGRYATRLLPIVSYSQLGIPDDLNRAWSILDTFDMYAPRYDNPRSLATVRRWYTRHGFIDVEVAYGPNGVIGRGRKPPASVHPDVSPTG